MSYSKFAYIYDELMKDAPYDDWVRLTETLIDKYKINPTSIVDLGCGTGSIAIPLRKKNYQMIGIDKSEDMLSVAYSKMVENKVMLPLLQQDMKEFNINQNTELIISFCDSLNYLQGISELKETFLRVNHHLEKDGYFLFDMHSPYKLTHIFAERTFAWDAEDISVIWLTEVDKERLTVEHDLTFFVKNSNGCYEKIKENHQQQTYSAEAIKQLLEKTGFSLVESFGDFQMNPVSKTSERIFYLAQKSTFIDKK